MRLHSPAQYQRVLRDSRCLHSRSVRLHLHNPDHPATPPRARLGITVSKRVSKLAVIRNRIKRITRDSFRQHNGQLPPGDYVIVAKPGKSPGDGLADELMVLWQRAILLIQARDTGTMSGYTAAQHVSDVPSPVGASRPLSSDR